MKANVPNSGAYLRQQGYSEIPEKFLARGAISLFVTDTLGYDIDRDRTGGCSMDPRPPSRRSGGDPFYKTFLGLRDARDTTLPHEYAHHFTLDTRWRPTAGNLWADLRNDYWLWLQRHGMAILGRASIPMSGVRHAKCVRHVTAPKPTSPPIRR